MSTGVIMQNAPWWEAHLRNEPPHRSVVARAEHIRSQQQVRINNTRRLIDIYEYGYRASSAWTSDGVAVPLNDTTFTLNALRNQIDTIHSKEIKHRVEPMALTSGGTYSAKRIAKERTKAYAAEFERNEYEKIRYDVKLDAKVTDHGAGAIKVYVKHGRPCMEHVPIEQFLIDDAEGRRRNPRTLIQMDQVDRYQLIDELCKEGDDDPALYGTAAERKQGIIAADLSRFTRMTTEHYLCDVYEAWHLPSGPDAEDGRHTICVDGCTLVDEPWEWECFPVYFYVPRPRRRSFWGLSFAYTLAAAQRAYEHGTDRIMRSVKKGGGTHIIARKGAVNYDEIDNDVGTIIEAENGAADVQTWNPDLFNPQMLQWVESLPRWMSEVGTGMSQLAASGQVPAGLANASGKALQVFTEEDNDALLPEYREDERMAVGVAKLIHYCWKEILRRQKTNDNADDDSYFVEYKSKGSLERISIADILGDEDDEPIITTFPVSQLAKTPAARFSQLIELLNAGAITIEQFKRLYEIPDIEAENEVETSDCTAVDWAVDQMVFYGKPVIPDGFYNFEYAKERVRKHINLFRQFEVPQDRLALLNAFIVEMDKLSQPPAPVVSPAEQGPPMPPGPDMGGGPPGAGGPPGGPMPGTRMTNGQPPGMPPPPMAA